jgi:hypothetical protein
VRKGTLLLGMAVAAGMLCCLFVILSKSAIWAARLLFLPSFVACIVLLALYAKNSRQ